MRATPRSWTERARATIALGALSMLLTTAACTTTAASPGTSGDVPAPEATDRIHLQAHDALVRWADAVRASGGASISFVGALTSQIGDWAADEGESNKLALMAGRVEATTGLPNDTPSRKDVRWLDGTTVEVNVLSAAVALRDLVDSAAGECPGCDPLLVTGATLATGLVETSEGPAEAPTWVYTIAGTSVRVTRVAVDGSVTVVPPPWNVGDPPAGISIESAAGSADSRKLEVSFTGAVDEGDVPCGADYTAEAVESELAVVVIVLEHRPATPRASGPACRLVGRTRTAEVTLKSKLRDRAVLEIRQGLPVPLRAPP